MGKINRKMEEVKMSYLDSVTMIYEILKLELYVFLKWDSKVTLCNVWSEYMVLLN